MKRRGRLLMVIATALTTVAIIAPLLAGVCFNCPNIGQRNRAGRDPVSVRLPTQGLSRSDEYSKEEQASRGTWATAHLKDAMWLGEGAINGHSSYWWGGK